MRIFYGLLLFVSIAIGVCTGWLLWFPWSFVSDSRGTAPNRWKEQTHRLDDIKVKNTKSIARNFTLSEQAKMIGRFLARHGEDPTKLGELLSELTLPSQMRREIAMQAVATSAGLKPLETLNGIDSVTLNSLRNELVFATIGAWSKVSPRDAFAWAENSPYPDAVAIAAPEYWRTDPTAAAASLKLMKPAVQASVIGIVSASEVAISSESSRIMLETMSSLVAGGDMNAQGAEKTLLFNQVKQNPEQVEKYLETRQSNQLRDQFAPDLALRINGNDWAAANAWLLNFQGSQVTPASYTLWNRWLESDQTGLKKFLDSTTAAANHTSMVDYFLKLANGTENQRQMATWLATKNIVR